ncbi:hypothetical protein [Sphingosinicella sp. BN140058]|uniref:hypothetical protein n=1 Tax=Sphingosinicella sp. BN140058 TaxID=1892855 RepID=UPI0010133069|nr:hypothetical protein [Sphingosinicella sp. BN140058]QAY75434.1 hypothetical protein ETR14_01995 [Sphingosinicella sp. BN140058]
MTPKPLIERAFELAIEGGCGDIHALRRRLVDEGYSKLSIAQHLGGRHTRRQVADRIAAARAVPAQQSSSDGIGTS